MKMKETCFEIGETGNHPKGGTGGGDTVVGVSLVEGLAG